MLTGGRPALLLAMPRVRELMFGQPSGLNRNSLEWHLRTIRDSVTNKEQFELYVERAAQLRDWREGGTRIG